VTSPARVPPLRGGFLHDTAAIRRWVGFASAQPSWSRAGERGRYKGQLQQGFAAGEMGSQVSLHGSNLEPPMSALRQKQTSADRFDRPAV